MFFYCEKIGFYLFQTNISLTIDLLKSDANLISNCETQAIVLCIVNETTHRLQHQDLENFTLGKIVRTRRF